MLGIQLSGPSLPQEAPDTLPLSFHHDKPWYLRSLRAYAMPPVFVEDPEDYPVSGYTEDPIDLLAAGASPSQAVLRDGSYRKSLAFDVDDRSSPTPTPTTAVPVVVMPAPAAFVPAADGGATSSRLRAFDISPLPPPPVPPPEGFHDETSSELGTPLTAAPHLMVRLPQCERARGARDVHAGREVTAWQWERSACTPCVLAVRRPSRSFFRTSSHGAFPAPVTLSHHHPYLADSSSSAFCFGLPPPTPQAEPPSFDAPAANPADVLRDLDSAPGGEYEVRIARDSNQPMLHSPCC